MGQRQNKTDGLGERLRHLRTARGYSLRELAKAVGTSHRMIAYYEVQGGNPPADVLARLARALGVSSDELLGLKRARGRNGDVPESLRMMRRLRQVEKLPAKDRRSVLQLIDSLVTKEEALSRAHG